MNLSPLITYNDGRRGPQISLGTVNIRGQRGKIAILDAINNGYRAIDSSTNYHNEGIVGQAVAEAAVPREELWITSKLPGQYHKYDDAMMIIQEQLARTNLSYFDEYLIHWPNPDEGLYVEAWRALIDAQKLGLIRTIGVSNFEPDHLDKIVEETGVVPAVNQIEVSPYFHNEKVHAHNQKLGIVTEAWSPVGRDKNDVKEEETLVKIAEKYDKSTTQVVLRWLIQRGIAPIIKAVDPVHQQENLDVFDFELTDSEMQAIFDMDRGEDGRIEGQNPNEYHEYV